MVLVSASGEEMVAPIGRMLGVTDVIATRMVIGEDGRYTGEIEFYAAGPAKAEAIERFAAERGVDLESSFAYSDSITDEPMLAMVGHPFAVNPDRALRRVATSRDWPVLDFSKPVALAERTRFHEVRRPAVAATLVGAGLAAAGALLYMARRRARGHNAG